MKRTCSQFFEEVAAIKTVMEEITNLVRDLHNLNEETKSTHSAKVLRGLRDRMDSNALTYSSQGQSCEGKTRSYRQIKCKKPQNIRSI
ncbi:Syntaxin-112 [Vitis vinifera]|uniref:Syntaxin-112 n=1 Tax=Vitis vinifera TaxID=29760 RepID=A0A438FM44_VITVI|nr:Syntaxin-112 [Vitis vinifera]